MHNKNVFSELLFLILYSSVPFITCCTPWTLNSRLPWQVYSSFRSLAFIGGDSRLSDFPLTAIQLTSFSRQNELKKYNKTLDLPVKDLSTSWMDSMVHKQGSKHLKIHNTSLFTRLAINLFFFFSFWQTWLMGENCLEFFRGKNIIHRRIHQNKVVKQYLLFEI